MQYLKNIFVLTRLSIRELIRNKIMQGILLFMIIMLFANRFFTYFTFGEEIKIVTDIGLSAITFLGLLSAVWAGAWGLRTEMEQKTLWVTLSYPVSRSQVLTGKWLAGIVVVFWNILIMTIFFLLVLYLKMKNTDEPAFFAGTPIILKAVFLAIVESIMALSVVIFLSIFLMPIPVLTVFFALYIVAHMSHVLTDIGLKMSMAGFAIVRIVYIFIPNFTYFNIKDLVVFGTDVSGSYIAWSALYGLLYSLALMVMAGMAFTRKELK